MAELSEKEAALRLLLMLLYTSRRLPWHVSYMDMNLFSNILVIHA
jgi:hypothetical protein